MPQIVGSNLFERGQKNNTVKYLKEGKWKASVSN